MTLSDLQFPLAQMFMVPGAVMSVAQAKTVDQRPFRSFCIRQYIVYSPAKKGFVATKKGLDDVGRFLSRSIQRSEAMWDRPLTAYLDPESYAPALAVARKARKQRRKNNVREIQQAAAS